MEKVALSPEISKAAVVAGLNSPEVAQKAGLDNAFRIEANRVQTATEAQTAGTQAQRKTETADYYQDRLDGKPSGRGLFNIDTLRDVLHLNDERWKARREELLKEAKMEAAKQKVAETTSGLYADLFVELPQAERDAVVEERFKEAERVQKIALGVALGEQLKAAGVDNVDWAQDLAVLDHEANTSPIASGMEFNGQADEWRKKTAAVERIMADFEAGRVEITAAQYQKAAEIYRSWVGRIQTDVLNQLDGDRRARFSVVSFGNSLAALRDSKKLVTEGAAEGKWYS